MFFKNNPVFIIVLYLTLIKIKLNMEQSFKKGVVLNLASLVEYSEGGVLLLYQKKTMLHFQPDFLLAAY